MKKVVKFQSDKIFITNRSKLEGRLDVNYYRENLNLENTIRLSKTARVRGGKRIPLGYDYSYTETANLYLRVVNMNDDGDFKFNEFKFISDELYSILNRYEVFNNDLIISIAGTIGKVKILRNIPEGKRVILTENCAKIVITKDDILPDYLSILLQSSFVQKQIKLSYIQTTIPKLGLDKIGSLKLPPLPDLATQQKIIILYQNIYTQKQQKEVEARLLLLSIDTYMLNELGITVPKKNNSLQKIYTTSFSELTGGRFDVFDALNKNSKIEGGIYPNKKLREIGVLKKGQSITSERIVEGDYPVIAGGQSSPYSHNQYNFEGDVITISASGAYSGYVWYHTTPIFASDCTVIKTKDTEVISTSFLFELLKLKQQEIYNLQQGAGQPHVYASDLAKLNIPIPPKDIQEKIVAHIQDLRNRAKQLQVEATLLIENIKAEIEHKILYH